MKYVQKLYTTINSFKKWFIKAPLKHKIIVGIIALLLGAGITQRVVASSKNQPQYQTAQVERGSIISTVSGNGTISGGETSIESPTNGLVEELDVKNGDSVAAGDQLFIVKSSASAQEQATAYASYQSAASSLTSAKDNTQSLDAQMWSAQQSLTDAQNNVNYINDAAHTTNPATKEPYTDLEKQNINNALIQAQKNFSAAEQKYKDAGMAVSASQAQVNAAWLSYQATQNAVVTAPVSGTIANLSVNVGSSVSTTSSGGSSSSSSSTTTSSPVLLIGDFSNLQIKVQVSEIDIPKVHAGEKATITLDAYPDKTFVGNVNNVDLIGTNTSGVVNYNVYINFVSPPSDIHPGMSASVIIQTDRRDNVLIVPSSAVQTVNDQTTVRVMKQGKVTPVPVEIGISDDTNTEITSGLSEGDTIVTATITRTRTSGQTTSPFSGIGGRGGGFGGGGAGGGGGNFRVITR